MSCSEPSEAIECEGIIISDIAPQMTIQTSALWTLIFISEVNLGVRGSGSAARDIFTASFCHYRFQTATRKGSQAILFPKFEGSLSLFVSTSSVIDAEGRNPQPGRNAHLIFDDHKYFGA